MVIVQYLDDILFVGRDRLLTTKVARDTAAHLARKSFLVNHMSVLDATQSLTWMEKQLSLHRPGVAHKPEWLADIVGRWVAFSLSCYTHKPLQRLVACIGWLARPGFPAGCFLMGAQAWLRVGPPPRIVFRLPCVGACWRQLQRGIGGGNPSRLKARLFACTLMLPLVRACLESPS